MKPGLTRISKFTAINYPQDHVRINYFRTDGDYSNKSVWYWGDVKDAPSNWPDGVNFQPNGKYGAYLDIPLTQAAKSIGFFTLR